MHNSTELTNFGTIDASNSGERRSPSNNYHRPFIPVPMPIDLSSAYYAQAQNCNANGDKLILMHNSTELTNFGTIDASNSGERRSPSNNYHRPFIPVPMPIDLSSAYYAQAQASAALASWYSEQWHTTHQMLQLAAFNYSMGGSNPMSPNLPPVLRPLPDNCTSNTSLLSLPLATPTSTTDIDTGSVKSHHVTKTSQFAIKRSKKKDPPIIAKIQPIRRSMSHHIVDTADNIPWKLNASTRVDPEMTECGRRVDNKNRASSVVDDRGSNGQVSYHQTLTVQIPNFDLDCKNNFASTSKDLMSSTCGDSLLLQEQKSSSCDHSEDFDILVQVTENMLCPQLKQQQQQQQQQLDTSALQLLSDVALTPPTTKTKRCQVEQPLCCIRHLDAFKLNLVQFRQKHRWWLEERINGEIRIKSDCVGSETVSKQSPIYSWAVGMELAEFETRAQMLRLQVRYRQKVTELNGIRAVQRRKSRRRQRKVDQKTVSLSSENGQQVCAKTGKQKQSIQSKCVSALVGLEEELTDDDYSAPIKVSGVSECRISNESQIVDKVRVLWLENGLFYDARVDAIAPPDIYQIRVDGQRQSHPLLVCLEELLKQALFEHFVTSKRHLQVGQRVCAPWSGQLKALYPATVAAVTSSSASSELVYLNFDDGDRGDVLVKELRWLPQDFPITKVISPILPEFLGRRRISKRPADTDEAGPLEKGLKNPALSTKASKSNCNRSVDHVITPVSSDCCTEKEWHWKEEDAVKVTLSRKQAKSGKIYHSAIERDGETIRVGDCVIFTSNSSQPTFMGIIGSMWSVRGGQMKVSVEWCYHPQETKTRPDLPFKNRALFKSKHCDENDAQTIEYRCELMTFHDFVQSYCSDYVMSSPRASEVTSSVLMQSPGGCSTSSSTASGHQYHKFQRFIPRHVYYVAGTYDPVHEKMVLADDVGLYL